MEPKLYGAPHREPDPALADESTWIPPAAAEPVVCSFIAWLVVTQRFRTEPLIILQKQTHRANEFQIVLFKMT